MAKLSKQKCTLLIVLGCVALVLGAKFILHLSRDRGEKDIYSPRTKGNPDAKLKITEYIDFQCPSCAKGTKILGRYLKTYPDKIFLEIKYFPLGMHKHAFTSARYTECAARQGKFWPFHDLLIQRQDQWKRLIDADPAFRIIAEDVELDLAKLDACLEDEELNAIIAKDKETGESLGVRSTPTYFFGDDMFVGTDSLTRKLNKYFPRFGQTMIETE